jgi:hypothetical protein
MTDPWLQQLYEWRNFYVLLGAAAATLTGLMFVVVSLGPHLIAAHTATGVRVFVTPTVVGRSRPPLARHWHSQRLGFGALDRAAAPRLSMTGMAQITAQRGHRADALKGAVHGWR